MGLMLMVGLAGPLQLLAQPFWVKDVGGIGNDQVADVKVDTDGMIYMTGEFGGTMTVDGETYTSAGSIDLFVAKLDPSGEVLWFRTGGGTGIDRGLKVSLGTGSQLTFSGEFLGTASFQSQTLTSAGGTADMFVAVLDKSDGSLQWIRQGGGATGTDRPYGVSLAADGRVAVAGEFRGSATWSGNTITSATDPTTGEPDTDVFIATYTPTGDLAWLQQGTAKFADRAIDLVHDPSGALYVTGQFSDTITFDQVHPNAILNASFLVKFDGAGNEVWFRRMGGGGFNHVRDLVMKGDGRLALVGDLQGTMIYFGAAQTNIASGEPFAYYLLDIDGNGALVGHTTVGSTSGVSAAGLSVQGNDIAVLGQFNCRFSDLSALYGQGVFMAVGPEDLFVSRHLASNLALLEGQQFGGRSAKSATAIAHLSDGQVVFMGSYQGNLIFPAVADMEGDISTGAGLQGNGIGTYCGDPDYGIFVANLAAALTDGFIARGYVPGREPYDWWRRTDTGCERVELEPCIRQGAGTECPDTLRACGSLLLNVDLKYSHASGQATNYLGPPVTYLWSSGSTAATIGVVNTGAYWVRVTSANGCYIWTDTVQVIIEPAPPIPLISDDVVLNTAASGTETIELCDPETHWVWTPNGGSQSVVFWTAPNGDVVQNDSVQVDTTGLYTVTSVATNGCTRSNSVNVVDYPTIPLPDIDVELLITFPDDTDGNDSLQICPGDIFEFTYTPTWTVNGVSGTSLPEGLLVNWGFEVPVTGEGDDGPQTTSLSAGSSGWVVRELVVMVSNKPCGEDSVLFFRTDSIYVEVFTTANTQVTITGPTVLCDGDSAVIVGSCTGCDQLEWSGPDFTQLTPNSIVVFSPGTYSVQGSANDPNGCATSSQASVSITTPAGIVLSVSPGDGIICPGGSATLATVSTGTDHVWFGPEGPITGQGASLVTGVPGDYYLEMDVGGCAVTSNSATLVNYGTPFLDVSPQPVLCSLEDEVDLIVVATPGSNIVWNSPLTGGSITQPVSTPGTYSVSVTACDITTTLSIEVTLSTVAAAVTTPGPFTLCNGDSVLLQGITDQSNTYWMPGALEGNALWVSDTGNYYFVAEDADGCADSTATVQVTAIGFPEPVEASGGAVCAGDAILLQATGSGTITWFADPEATAQLGVGPSLSFVPGGSTTVYAVQSQGGCTGTTDAASVEVLPRPAPLLITGPTVVCEGTPFSVSVSAPETVTLVWTTPGGTFSGTTVTIPEAAIDDGGVYSCVAQYNGCSSPVASQTIGVFARVPLGLPDEAILCLGGALTLTVPPTFTAIQWSTGSNTTSTVITSGQQVTVNATDQFGCAAVATVQVVADDCELVIPNIFSPNGDGQNETWLPEGGFISARASIYNRWGNLVFEGDMLTKAWSGKHYKNAELCSEGVYFYVIQFERVDGSSKEQSGYVQLIR